MVSARLVDIPDGPEDEDLTPLPDMMFAPGEEPVGVRVLTYQSSSVLKRIFNALDDEEVDIIRRSAFGKLIEIADKPVFSGRFARYLLSRQLKTKKKYEAWFRFAGKPVRFSLREFAIVTGLPCGKYPRKSKMKLKKTIAEKPYWPSLFGKVEVVTVSSVIKMLYRKTVKDKEIRIKYACLALLESVLLPTSLKMKIAREHAEAIEDLEEFFSYPWGRLAFEMLIGSIKERDEVSLSQNTIAVKGFALALQLVLVQAVPSLTEVVEEICSSSETDSEEVEGIGRDIFKKKNTLNTAHARNVDKQSKDHVCSLLLEDSSPPLDESSLDWSDEEHDAKVQNLLSRINGNYTLTTSSFRGGLTKIDVQRMRERCKTTSRSRKASYVEGNGEHDKVGDIAGFVIEKIKPQFETIDEKLSLASRTVAGIEGKVVVQVNDMLAKFKEEIKIFVKELVALNCKDQVVSHPLSSPLPTAAPVQENGPVSVTGAVEDANAITIGNVLRNLSEYSTPPRSARMSQDENVTPPKKDHVVPGFVSQTPDAETCAHSAHSEIRSRQIAFHASLHGLKRQRENLMPEPSFSLGLTQDEHNEGDDRILVTEDRLRECTSDNNVEDNLELGQGSRKSKRQKTVPSGLVEDYQCGRHIMSRVREGHKYIFSIEPQSDITRKFAQLSVKMSEKFVINVGGLAVSAKDIQLLVERSRFFSPKVIDIIIRVARAAIRPNLPSEGPRSAELLDSKFVTAINKTFPRFLKSTNKDSFKFPKGLMDIFPSKDGPPVHPLRYYFPFSIGMKHWVGICFDARCGVITVLDCNTSLYNDRSVEKYLHSISQMLPYLARYVGQTIGEDPIIHCYDVARPKCIAQNKNPADSGLMALLLMATHAVYGIETCKHISPEILEEEGRRAAILTYQFKDQL